MQTITRSIDQSQLLSSDIPEDGLFFDIETTGFSSKSSHIYMIGCAWCSDKKLHICQWFAETPSDEKAVLIVFSEFILRFPLLISFNGLGFDVPFIQNRIKVHQLDDPFSNSRFLDLFKTISGLKHLIRLDNYRQKTIERFLGLGREDLYTGGELISIYKEYAHEPSKELLNTLLLHNYEDVLGMADIYAVTNYEKIFNGDYEITGSQIRTFADPQTHEKLRYELLISYTTPYIVPRELHTDYYGIYFQIKPGRGMLRIPVFYGELKYFYSNYKDYYFLPAENRAIHKSLALYVDKEYREKCHPYNCYTIREGYFLPQMDPIFEPVFHLNYKDKMGYFEMKRSLFEDRNLLRKYIDHVLFHIRYQE